jgi:hypothetical protein
MKLEEEEKETYSCFIRTEHRLDKVVYDTLRTDGGILALMLEDEVVFMTTEKYSLIKRHEEL